ncbi:MAG: CARDB domain-containing protein [Phycisphaerae bacterium]
MPAERLLPKLPRELLDLPLTDAPTNSPATPLTETTGPSQLLISEILFNEIGSDVGGEWIEIYNNGTTPINLTNYKIGDEETPGAISPTEGMFRFPTGATINPGEVQVVTNDALVFQASYGFLPNYAITGRGLVPDMIQYTSWDPDGTRINGSNGTDEFLLLGPTDQVIDAVSWGTSTFAFNPPLPDIEADGQSWERIPAGPGRLQDTNTAADWVLGSPSSPGTINFPSPTPFVSIDLPASSDTGSSNSDNLTNVTLPTVNVTVNQAGLVQLGWTGATATVLAQQAVSAGVLSFTPPEPLAEGTYDFVATFFPDSGQPSVTTAPLTVTIDTTPPRVLSASLTDRGGTLEVRVEFDDASALAGATPADFAITGPVTVAVESLTIVGTTATLLVVPVQPSATTLTGLYELTVGPGIVDAAGNAMPTAFTRVFPLGVWGQVDKLLPADGAAGDRFGFSVAVSGNLALVGSYLDDDNGTNSGSAYLFDVATGAQIAKLKPDDGDWGDQFGRSVAISGNTALIGSRYDEDNGVESGSAYLFDVTTGTQIAKLKPLDGAAEDQFGRSVALSGNVALVGSRFDDDNGADSGSAYLFDAITGALLAKLKPNDGAAGDEFGFSVALSGNIALIGSQFDDDNGPDSGSAYLFDVTTFTQIAKLKPDDGAAGDYFGYSVAVDGNLALVGSYQDEDNGPHSGSAYLFDITTGTQVAKLKAADGSAGDEFGTSVALSGNTALVGSISNDANGSRSGSAYLFDVTTGAQIAKLTPADGAAGDMFGGSVDLNGNTAFVGSSEDDDRGSNSGSVYVFETVTAAVLDPTIFIDLQPASDTGSSSSDDLTNDTTPTFDVIVNQPGIITVDWTGDGVADVTLTAAAAGTSSFTTPPLADGSYAFVATFTSDIGQPAVFTPPLTVTIDTTPPAVVSTTASGTRLGDGSLNVSFSEPPAATLQSGDFSLLDPDGNAVAVTASAVSGTLYLLTFPPLTLFGDYTLAVAGSTTDAAGNALVPYSETFFVEPVADLVVSVETPAPAFSGRNIDVRFTVTNEGLQPTAASWIDRIYLVPLDDGTEVFLGQLTRPRNLNTGESYTRSNSYALPQGISGQFRIRVEADAQNTVFEIDNDNNVNVSQAFSVTLSPYADLQVQAVNAPAAVVAGQTLAVSWSVVNNGVGATDGGQWLDRVWLSQNPNGLDGSALFLGDVPSPTFLDVGESYSQNFSTPISTSLTGSWFVYVQTDADNRQYEFDFEQNNTTRSAVATQVQPIASPAFFGVTNVVAAPSEGLLPGQSVYVTWTVENTGGEPITGSWSDAIFLSPTATFSDTQSTLLARLAAPDVAPLEPGQSYWQAAFVTLPASAVGTWYLFVDPDNLTTASGTGGVGDDDVEKSLGVVPLQIDVPPSAKVEVDGVDIPADAEAGLPVDVSWTVTNNGFAPTSAGSWVDAVWLSRTPELTTSGPNAARLLGTRTRLGGLAPAQSYTTSTSFTLPTNVAGEYYVIVQTDRNNVLLFNDPTAARIVASATTLNVAPFVPGTSPVTVADLQPVELTAPQSIESGRSLTATWRATNLGPDAITSAGWTDRLYLSPTPDLSGPGVVDLGSRSRFGSLGLNASYDESRSVTIPDGIVGSYYLVLRVNATGNITETNSANNLLARPLTVAERPLPELSVSVPAVVEPVQAGEAFDVSWVVTNNGGQTLPGESAWLDNIYLSDTGLVDASSVRLTTVNRTGGLAAGGSYTGTATVTIPRGVEGNKFIVVLADAQRRVLQTTSAGTLAARPVAVVPADFAALQVDAIAFDGTPFAGQAFAIDWRVTHADGQGTTSADRWFDSVFLSRDQFLDPATAIPLGSIERVGALSPGESYTAGINARLPNGISGPYYVFVQADVQNRIYDAGSSSGKVAFAQTPIQVVFPPLADLAVADVFVPPMSVTGEPATPEITWQVTNVSGLEAVGTWVDAVYLSADTTFDAADKLIARVPRTGPLAAGASYTGSTSAMMPADVVPGQYYVIVRTNARGDVRESSIANNSSASATTTSLDVPELPVNTPVDGTIADGGERYFRVSATAGEPLVITAELAQQFQANLYVRYGAPPTPSQFDFVFNRPAELAQVVSIPNATQGTYYVLLEGTAGAGEGQPFTLTATVPGFGITSTDVTRASNRGSATLTVSGAKFTPNTLVSLVDGAGNVITDPSRVIWRDESTLWATFNLTGVPAGVYDLQAVEGGAVSRLADALTVDTSAAGSLQLAATAPGVIRAGREAQVTFFYENTGNTDIVSPLLQLSAEGARLRLDDGTLVSGLAVLGINDRGPAGILPPGFVGSVRYTFVPDEFVNGQENTYGFEAQALGDTSVAVDYAAVKAAGRPAAVSEEAWDVIWANFTADAGPTLADLQSSLAETATYLSQVNRYVRSLASLLSFRLTQADAGLLPRALSTETDLAVPSRGLQLELTRSAYGNIAGRSRVGLFGVGWVTPWDTRLIAVPGGQQVLDLTTAQVGFQEQPDGSFVGPAGFGTLRRLGDTFDYTDAGGTVYRFDADGLLLSLTDRNANQITASRTVGRITQLIHSDQTSISFTYTPEGFVQSATTSDGRGVAYAYGAGGQRLSSVTTNRGTTNYTYDTFGNPAVAGALSTIARADGSVASFTYDDQGRQTGAFGPFEGDTTISYLGQGEIRTTDALGNVTSYLLTDLLKPGRVTDARGNVVRLEYDQNGTLSREVLPGGLAWRYQYDAAGKLIGVINPLGASSAFSYEEATGQLSLVSDPRGNQMRFAYDSLGNLQQVTNPDNTGQSFTYTPRGLPATQTNARGQVISRTFDDTGRLLTLQVPGGPATSFTYDAAGNVLTTNDAAGTTSYTYDAAGRVTQVSYPDGTTVSLAYDAAGRRQQLADNRGYQANYTYDAAGRLTGITDGSGSPVVSYVYDGIGRIQSQFNGNGTSVAYTYDAAGNVTSVMHLGTGGQTLQLFEYAYDARNRISQATLDDGQWLYTYDAAGQLRRAVFNPSAPGVQAQDVTYNYDLAGNRVSVVRDGVLTDYAANNRNAYISVGGVSRSYDADGNLLSDGTRSFTYDALNRLTSITLAGETTRFTYDGLGNLATVEDQGVVAQQALDPTSGFAFAEYGPGGQTLASRFFGLSPVAADEGAGRTFLGFDGTGWGTLATDGAGDVAGRFAYSPFGLPLGITPQGTTPQGSVPTFGVFGGEGALTRRGVVFSADGPMLPDLGRRLVPGNGLEAGQINPYTHLDNAWVARPAGNPDANGLSAQLIATTFNRANQPGFEFTSALLADPVDVSGGAATSTSLVSLSAEQPVTPLITPVLGASQGAAAAFLDVLATVRERNLGSGSFRGGVVFDGSSVRAQGFQSAALDPNQIVGPEGFGPDAMVGINAPQSFRIDFENVRTATAPAQVVTITAPLDPDWDLRTLELQTIAFNDTVAQIPAGRSFYSNIIDLRPQGLPLLVAIRAAIDPVNQQVVWTLSSIDPATGEAPEDPNSGLLPVNNDDRDGEGYVTFSVRGRSDVPSGTRLESNATIVFDNQPPLTTNTWLNTLDTGLPTTTLSAQVVPGTRRIDVQWEGTDDANGSGVATYDVFISTDGGTFTPWLTDVTFTRAEYVGAAGRQYAFYAVARDNTGNRTPTPTQPQASAALSPNAFVGAYLFYNNSLFDGFDAGANAADDAALATDKQPLFAGSLATFANYSGYSRGINGLFIDVAGPLGDVSVDDFSFSFGRSLPESDWAAAPAPAEVSVRPLAGQPGVSRITLTWPDNVLVNGWLRVSLLPTADTGLSTASDFYFGNVLGETGDQPASTAVNTADILRVRNAFSPGPVGITNPFDLDRDGDVDAADLAVVLANTTAGTAVVPLLDLRPLRETFSRTRMADDIIDRQTAVLPDRRRPTWPG